MKFGLYPRLALAGIRKNKRLYIPYLLTCTGMAMMYYIIIFLQHNEMLDGMRGGTTASTILALGGWVVAIFACIFLFYTHSFLLRRRKKEFGLYNILGMGRHHLVRIEIWETIFVAIGTTAAGLLCGIAFSKLAELGLMNLMHGSISYVFSISAPAIMATLLIFGVIHLLLLLRAAVAVGRTSAIQLLQSEAAGEKPPRANWFLGLLGVILLGVAYYMAVTIKEPLMALALFFVAVVLVILATYLIMISGSVLLCRQLQKNTAYYYNPRHFVSVSSMAYRMKRNGAGLASICILATMVLVMLSSSACLYFGAEDSLKATYPHEFALEVWLENSADMPKLQEALTKAGAAYGVNVWEKGTVEPGSGNTWSAAFDTGLSQEQQLALSRAIDEALGDTDITWNYFRSYRAEAADDFYGTYGSLFFIGIVLSVLFICAAVLIIYYKQLCEGYEDQPRFAIMQKVGMTAADIRRSVNSQLLTVFFLPLAGAALHMAFAFPMIRRMLLLFELHNTGLFIATALVSFAVLAVVYTLVYKATSNAYYRIVKCSV